MMGTPASAKYARIPSQIVAPLGPAANAPTRTAAFVIALSSATPIGTRSPEPANKNETVRSVSLL